MRAISGIIRVFLVLMLITGIVYPVLIYLIGQSLFPAAANGSMISVNGRIVGSELIAQEFLMEKYFHPRPSAIAYKPLPSGASNLSLSSTTLLANFIHNRSEYVRENPAVYSGTLPAEMLFTSASGVDPDISMLSALQQAERVSRVRGFSPYRKAKLLSLIHHLSRKRLPGLAGSDIINVLILNIETDKLDRE